MRGCKEDVMEAGQNYRKITASMVPVATMIPNTPNASKSERSSVMVFPPSKSKIARSGGSSSDQGVTQLGRSLQEIGAKAYLAQPPGRDWSILLATGADSPDSHRPTGPIGESSFCSLRSSISRSIRHCDFDILDRSSFPPLAKNIFRRLIAG
jgi:hypothetical protein